MLERELALQNLIYTPHIRNKWNKILPLMGIVPDKKLARRISVSVARVCQVRGALGIAPVSFPRLCDKYGAIFNPSEKTAVGE